MDIVKKELELRMKFDEFQQKLEGEKNAYMALVRDKEEKFIEKIEEFEQRLEKEKASWTERLEARARENDALKQELNRKGIEIEEVKKNTQKKH